MELSSVPVESQVLRRLDGDLRLEHGRPVPGHIFVLSAGIVDEPKKKVPPSWRWRKRSEGLPKKSVIFSRLKKNVGAFHVVLGQNGACASSFGFEAKQFSSQFCGF